MRRFITILILIITAMSTQAQTSDKQAIEALYKQMYRAMIAKDIETLGSLLDENSVLIHMTLVSQSENTCVQSRTAH